MDNELHPLDHLLRKDWWKLGVALCAIWAFQCQLDGNSVFETIAAPLLVGTWLGAVFLLDRWGSGWPIGGMAD